MAVCILHKSELTLDVCEECLIKASEQMLANFGEPEVFYCGVCGKKCRSKEAMISHLDSNSKGECGDA